MNHDANPGFGISDANDYSRPFSLWILLILSTTTFKQAFVKFFAHACGRY